MTCCTSLNAQDSTGVEPGEGAEVSDESSQNSNVISEDSWVASPRNWNNSKYNYDNSKFNFTNSPRNYANRESNPSRVNIVNLFGVVIGYVVKKPDGGLNYFDNEGNRIGYSPDGGISQFDEDGDATKFRIEEKD